MHGAHGLKLEDIARYAAKAGAASTGTLPLPDLSDAVKRQLVASAEGAKLVRPGAVLRLPAQARTRTALRGFRTTWHSTASILPFDARKCDRRRVYGCIASLPDPLTIRRTPPPAPSSVLRLAMHSSRSAHRTTQVSRTLHACAHAHSTLK